jgi:Caspase domain
MEDKPRDSIYKAIREYYTKAKPSDQLVIYFAGHGDADNELLDDGFIVCSDSKAVEEDPMRNSYIPYDKIKKILNNISALQILVLLDVCHGGTFDSKAFAAKGSDKKVGTYNITNQNVLQLLKDKLPLRTRKFLSSVGTEPAFDGEAGKHSPFANFLLQILRSKGSGSNGIITLKEIYAVLEKASLNETATLKISPDMNDFGNVDAFTEFIFIPVQASNEIVKKQ